MNDNKRKKGKQKRILVVSGAIAGGDTIEISGEGDIVGSLGQNSGKTSGGGALKLTGISSAPTVNTFLLIYKILIHFCRSVISL